jgi:hypothetical protein|tara:strand:- start:49 stop:711 length:663 start_codon:yes stop_codon:yes gene_type:complete
MAELKPETIKLVSPNGTRFRWSYYVTPDEYKGVRKWKGDIIIPVGTQMKDDKGELVEATQFIVDQLEQLLERWKGALKEAYPDRKFTLTKSLKTGEPSFPWSFEEDGLVIRVSKKASGVNPNTGQPYNNTPVAFYTNDLRLMGEEERQKLEKIDPETTGQMSFLAKGYDAGGNGVGIKCIPLSICFRNIVPFTGGGASDFEAEAPSSYEEKVPTPTAADF